MTVWLENMELLQRIFVFIAFPASLILIIQTVMLFITGDGTAGTDIETDVSADVSVEDSGYSTDGLQFVTTRGIIAFLTVAGWTGVLCMELRFPQIVSVVVALGCGFGAMVGVGYMMRALLSLSSVGNIDYRTALGSLALVYLRIPGDGGLGKVNVTINGAHRECDAVTEGGADISTGQTVRVTDVLKDGVLVVECVDAVIVMPETGRGREN